MKKKDYLIKGDFVYRNTDVLHASSAVNSTLFLNDERILIDLEAANGTALLGYDSSIIKDAIEDIAALPMVPSFVETDIRVDLAEQLATALNCKLGENGKVAFDLGGGQGIELALKMAAKNNPGKRTIVVLDGSYHGRTITTSCLSASPRYRNALNGSVFNVVRLPVPELLPELGSKAKEYCMAHLKRLFSDERFGLFSEKGSDILGFIYEPVLNVSGLVQLDSDYLHQIVENIRSCGGMVIADEIFTGFYRFGTLLASTRHGIVPDFVVMSKIITNGIVPVSMVWGREKLVTEVTFPPGEHSVTFGNSVLSFAIAKRVISRVFTLIDEDFNRVSKFLQCIGDEFFSSLKGTIEGYKVDGLTAKLILKPSINAGLLKEKLVKGVDIGDKQYGLLVASTGLVNDMLMLHPPVTISDEEMEIAMSIVNRLGKIKI